MTMLSSYAVNGLSEKYEQVAGFIAHRDPFPNLETCGPWSLPKRCV